jgi:hypothetical protein
VRTPSGQLLHSQQPLVRVITTPEVPPRQLGHTQLPRSRQQTPPTKIHPSRPLVHRGGVLLASSGKSKLIEPVRKPVTTLGNLQLHRLVRLIEVVAPEILLGNSFDRLWEHARAHVQVSVARPCQSRPLRISNIISLEPSLLAIIVLADLDIRGQVCRPELSVVERHVAFDVADFVGDARVPEGVQVPVGAVEGRVDRVASDRDGFVVQGLGDVADEVDQPAESVVELFGGQLRRLLDALGVVCDGGDDAAFFGMAVAVVVDVADPSLGVVFGVDVVEAG